MSATTTFSVPFTTTVHKEVKPADNEPGNTDVKLSNSIYTTPGSLLHLVPLKIKPASLTFDPWCSFGPLDNRTFIDDFCHEKELTVKVDANTYNGTNIKIKEVGQVSKQPIILKEEIKVLFPLYNRVASALHLRVTDNDMRIHYDHGIDTYKEHSLNFYGSFGFLRNWKKYNFKLGFQLLQNNLTIQNRLKFNFKDELTWFMRATGIFDNFRAGIITAVDINNKQLSRKDLLLGYQKNEFNVSLKAQQSFNKKTQNYQNWKEWFNKYTLTGTYDRTLKERFGIELVSNPQQDSHVASLLVEYKYSDKGFTKIKIDSKYNLYFLIKKTLTSKLALSLGVFAPLTNKLQKNKIGVQVNLNI